MLDDPAVTHNQPCVSLKETPLEKNYPVELISSEIKACSTSNDKTVSKSPIVYTLEELHAIRSVYTKLTKDHDIPPSEIGLRTLVLTTILSKCRIDEATRKYLSFSAAVKKCDVSSLAGEDSWKEEKQILEELRPYAPCGTDVDGRGAMWIHSTTPITKDRECDSVKAGILYWLAVHADSVSLREGTDFVIDASEKSGKKEGNEQKMQNIYQCYPLRPRFILIAGTGFALRTFINGIIRVASLFTKQKILKRIKFVSLEFAKECIPMDSLPKYLGGGGGGIEDVEVWVKQRIEGFPLPDL